MRGVGAIIDIHAPAGLTFQLQLTSVCTHGKNSIFNAHQGKYINLRLFFNKKKCKYNSEKGNHTVYILHNKIFVSFCQQKP